MSGTHGWVTPPPLPEDVARSTSVGRQGLQITSWLGDTVVGTHHLHHDARGHLHPLTRALLGLSGGLLVVGVILFVQASFGTGAGLLLLGTGLGVVAMTRASRERRSPHFLIGEGREAQLPLPGSLLPAPCYPLVLSAPGGYHLLFAEGTEGVVEGNGGRATLGELVAAGRAWPAAGLPARAVSIPQRGRAWVRIGESTVVIESIEAGAGFRSSVLGGLDSRGLFSNACSFTAHALVLGLVFAVPPSSAALNLDSFNLDSKRVRFEMRGREKEQNAVPAWLRRQSSPDLPAAGPAARGEAGKVGNPSARPLRGRVAVKGKSPDLQAARQWAMEAAREAGVLGIMSRRQGGPLAHIFGATHALGPDALDAMGTLIANQVGEDSGTGGLGPIGTGNGGGGDARGILVGPGYNTIGDRRGGPNPWGSYGPPRQGLPDRKAGGAPPPPVIKVHQGSLDKELIRREIKKHLNEIRYCYSKELQGKPDLRGRVVVSFTIAATGRVVASQIATTTLGDQAVEGCITQAFFRWSFPKPPDQGMVVVSYPFVFHATEQ